MKDAQMGIQSKADASESDEEMALKKMTKKQVAIADKRSKEENMIYEIQ